MPIQPSTLRGRNRRAMSARNTGGNSTDRLRSRTKGRNTEVNTDKSIVGRYKTVVKRADAKAADRQGGNSTTRMTGRKASVSSTAIAPKDAKAQAIKSGTGVRFKGTSREMPRKQEPEKRLKSLNARKRTANKRQSAKGARATRGISISLSSSSGGPRDRRHTGFDI